mgnify:CR=1 FL=1
MSLTPSAGPLPDTPDELPKIINEPKSFPQALGALRKLGQVYGRDLTEDGMSISAEDFGPLIEALGVGSNPAVITSFTLYVLPLRRALARHFGVRTPDLVLMVDLAVLAYWRALQAESHLVRYLADGISNPHWVKKVEVLEKVKSSATAQYIRIVEALRAATGKALNLHPDRDVASILRFPEQPDAREPLHERRRAASRR